MRPMFYEYPQDKTCTDLKDQYMYGERYLVAPVQEAGLSARRVYLPYGARWRDVNGENEYEGGQWIVADAPLEAMPVFERIG